MIYIVRHGQTDVNQEGRLQGRVGKPLNSTGFKQAELVKEQLQDIEFDLVFSSPQERARQTAAIITGRPVISDPRIDVYDIGEADGMKKDEVKRAGFIPDPTVYKGIENPSDFVSRVFDFMKELENEYGNQEIKILIAGHRCTTGCIGAYFEGIPEDQNILRYSSDNGDFKVYQFSKTV
ncbi:MAG TPA: histidine phosphatase family protein [Sporosarcina sp.]|nr:histidine phosphatase family protein [Sporosarcina sp.]